MSILKKDFTYIDLFAGIGGFRNAMISFSNGKAQCLYSSEINQKASMLYEQNFNDKPLGDIREIDPIKMHLPSPDVICGGFPCQTFSKGGFQQGFRDSRGTLFREIIRIINCYDQSNKPKILLLENVQNLVNHDYGETWRTIHHEIQQAGYNVIERPIIVAPKDFGVPQLRNRAIIVAVRNDIYNGTIEFTIKRQRTGNNRIDRILENHVDNKYNLSDDKINILNAWDDFIHILTNEERVIGFPIWSDYFGKQPIVESFPNWKKEIILKNKELYNKHKHEIERWLKRWNIRDSFTPTFRKFEWQAGQDINSVYEGIIQFRTSGIRVKRPTESPALVAMDHRPIYGPLRRYITPREAARLQSFPDSYDFCDQDDRETFKQLGNAVNVKVIRESFSGFINYIDNILGENYYGN